MANRHERAVFHAVGRAVKDQPAEGAVKDAVKLRFPFVGTIANAVRKTFKSFYYNSKIMPSDHRHEDELTFSSSARRDLRIWGMFVIGAAFVLAALTVHPDENCNSNGECAPWLLPIAFAMGALFGLSGLATLIVNPNRGSRIDPDTGELVWWQNRYGTDGGDEGRIAPEEISKIRIDRGGEGKNQVHLYNRDGERRFYFDEEVIGWDAEHWSEVMCKRWPHIKVDLRD